MIDTEISTATEATIVAEAIENSEHIEIAENAETIEPAVDNEELEMTESSGFLPSHEFDPHAEPEAAVDTAQPELAVETPMPVIAEYVDEFADPVRYDLEYGRQGIDLPFYLGLATSAAEGTETGAARVLDLATGTGRLALALAAAGHKVTEVDINSGLLDVAKSKDGAEQVTWAEQDARSVKVRGTFDLAILAGNALQQFLTNDDRAAVLASAYRQLAPGGALAFAIRFPHGVELSRRAETPEIWHSYTDAGGSQVVVSGTQRYDAITQVMTHETYRQYAVDGSRAATPTATALRYSYPQELVAALSAARFEVEAMYADFNGTPLIGSTAPTASALVVVARKPQKAPAKSAAKKPAAKKPAAKKSVAKPAAKKPAAKNAAPKKPGSKKAKKK